MGLYGRQWEAMVLFGRTSHSGVRKELLARACPSHAAIAARALHEGLTSVERCTRFCESLLSLLRRSVRTVMILLCSIFVPSCAARDASNVGCTVGVREGARRPVSRVLYPPSNGGRWPFIWDARYRTPRATDPDGGAETRLPAASRDAGVPSLFGLAPGGVYRAVAVAGDAVRSYRTLSPLPAGRRPGRRFAFCGTVPGVAPAGRYPAPCFRGARTFLPRRLRAAKAAIRPSGAL